MGRRPLPFEDWALPEKLVWDREGAIAPLGRPPRPRLRANSASGSAGVNWPVLAIAASGSDAWSRPHPRTATIDWSTSRWSAAGARSPHGHDHRWSGAQVYLESFGRAIRYCSASPRCWSSRNAEPSLTPRGLVGSTESRWWLSSYLYQ
jgi:hypothetical protein